MQEEKKPKNRLGIAAAILGVLAAALVAIIIFRATRVTPGTIKITLESYGGSPKQWSYIIDDTSVIEYVGADSKEVDSGADGGSIEETYSFRALKQGETDLTFEYKNITDGSVDAEETKTSHVTIDENMNIKVDGV